MVIKRTTRTQEIPKEWQDLFLAVADLVDGNWNVKIDRPFVEESYNKIFKTKVGEKIYSDAIANTFYSRIK